MFKFALAAGIVFEWWCGSAVESVFDLAHALLQGLLAMLIAWMVLETCRTIYRTVMSFDDRPRASRTG